MRTGIFIGDDEPREGMSATPMARIAEAAASDPLLMVDQ